MIEPGYLAEVRGTLNVEGLLVALGFAVRVVLGAESATYQPHTMHFLILALTVTGLKVSVSPVQKVVELLDGLKAKARAARTDLERDPRIQSVRKRQLLRLPEATVGCASKRIPMGTSQVAGG